MLTGEYFVLDGALSLAFPTQKGQRMVVRNTKSSDLMWKSYDTNDELWFSASISLYDFSAVKTNNEEIAKQLGKLLKSAVRLNSEFLNNWNSFKIETFLEFPNNWGLGSSSTPTYLVAEWADVNPFILHFKTYDGSGYDVACAGATGPLTYVLKDDALHYEEIDWNPSFTKNMYFVHLNEKQSSQEGIDYYNKNVKRKKTIAKEITQITEKIIDCKDLNKFQELLAKHESIVSEALGRETIQQERFSDFSGTVKSLGAWGGDFALAVSSDSEDQVKKYFAGKGFDTVQSYDEMIFTS